ncbi:uncharacterized protein TNCV_1386761 [Trichonephila clavipes]|nr:uncharacterized protein TNCV_1386761 [Trichonephila clavipes]
MYTSSSSVNPTPLAHADTQRDNHPRGDYHNGAQRDLNYMTPEIRKARGINVLPEVYFSGKDLETRFYASQQRQNQEPKDFVYDLLKLHKKLELGMPEKALVDHIFVRLEPQVQDCVVVRNPQNTV